VCLPLVLIPFVLSRECLSDPSKIILTPLAMRKSAPVRLAFCMFSPPMPLHVGLSSERGKAFEITAGDSVVA
jgi:hypothetical protein